MHRHTMTAGDEPEDRVAGDGRATTGELDPDVGDSLDDHPGVADRPRLRRTGGYRGLGEVLDGTFGTAQRLEQPVYDGLRGEVAFTNGGVQRRDVVVAHLARQRRK